MKETIKISNGFKGMVAHRGAGKVETENTLKAFIRSAQKSYHGLECDIHLSKDRKLVISHDSNLMRVGKVNLEIEAHTYEEIKAVKFADINTGEIDEDIYCPLLSEYLEVCKKYDKVPVIELKESLDSEAVDETIREVEEAGLIDKVCIISFFPGYLTKIRAKYPDIEIEFLTQEYNQGILDLCRQFRFDIDAYYKVVDKKVIDDFHKYGLKVNVYTVDNEEDALRLISYGIDFITSNILE